MLHSSLVEKLAQEIKIAPLNIVRENLEMEILYNLSQSELSERIIFYGGTALRLAYKSWRFSEDLDFLFVRFYKKDKQLLEQVLENSIREYAAAKVEEVRDKKNTLFGLVHIKNSSLRQPFRIKIEMCKKPDGIKSENTLLSSPVSELEPIIKTATLASLQGAKILAINNRNKVRDWFDLWYLNQKLANDVKPNTKFPFSKPEFRNEIKRWLPRDKWKIVDAVISYYE